MAFATDYIVGDRSGWTINFDYEGWAKDKVFPVGDKLGIYIKLIFKYLSFKGSKLLKKVTLFFTLTYI